MIERIISKFFCPRGKGRRRRRKIREERIVTEQLKMRRPHLNNLPSIAIPHGYEFRTYRKGDEQVWAEIMNVGFDTNRTAGNVQEELTRMPQFIPDGLFFVTYGGKPVGSACAWRETVGEWREGVVYMVAVVPEHRGHRLGYFLTLLVLHWFREHGFENVGLTTDDWRLAALKEYLQLGFRPVITDDNMKQRWVRVIQQLNLNPLEFEPLSQD
jgi:mycothiol synthase